MSIKQDLLKARSYLTVIIGFILAFSIVFYVEKNTNPTDMKLPQLQLSENFPTLPITRGLDYQEAVWARIAWQYFINNTQESGLVNSAEGLPYTSLWDCGDYLLALISAHQLNVIDDKELDARMQKALTALGSLPLHQGNVPYLYYNTTDLKPVMTGYDLDYSLIDVGRLLVAFKVIIWRYPQYNALVQQTVKHWDLAALFDMVKDNASLKSRHKQVHLKPNNYRSGYGYSLYAINGLSLINTWAGIVLTNSRQQHDFITINGMEIPDDAKARIRGKPYPVINSLPYILSGLENGFNTESAEISWRIIQVQKIINQSSDRHGYVNMGLANVFSLIGKENANPDELQRSKDGILPGNQVALSLSTQAAFGWDALFNTTWTQQVRQQASTLFVPGRGWLEGVEAHGQKPSKLITATTNAVILESLMYTAQGKMVCFACQGTETASAEQSSGSH
ncbi:hypothetical protein C9426_05500 [Serratia sp. S1B]|nr:hypothetical protein C9426_05500 [Serratia sp. S1B]